MYAPASGKGRDDASRERAAKVADRLARLPMGGWRGSFGGRDWLVTRSLLADGRSEKLVARALGGAGEGRRDLVSLNLYRLASGPLLRPCEMPAEAAAQFVLGVDPR